MAKRKKSNSFFIGIFILTGLVLLVGFILWMGATQFFKEYDYYTTYFDESVQGLETGSAIKYLGVSCGMVDDVTVAPDGKLVQVVMKIDKTVKITDKINVQMEMAGLAGGKFLQLYKKEKTSDKQRTFDFEPPYPVIPSAPSSIGEITLAAQEIIQDVKDIPWDNISTELTKTLEGTGKFMHNKELYLIITEIKHSTELLTQALEKINNLSVYADAERTMHNLVKTSENLNQFTLTLNEELKNANIANVVDKIYVGYDTTIKNTNLAITNISNRVETSFIGMNSLVQDLMVTNKNLKKTLRTINDSPYLFLAEPPEKEETK